MGYLTLDQIDDTAKKYVAYRYVDSGFDVILESWTEQDYREDLAGCSTVEEVKEALDFRAGLINKNRMFNAKK